MMRSNKTILTAILAVVFAIVAAMPVMAGGKVDLDEAIQRTADTIIALSADDPAPKVALFKFGIGYFYLVDDIMTDESEKNMSDYVLSELRKILEKDSRITLISQKDVDRVLAKDKNSSSGLSYLEMAKELGATYVFTGSIDWSGWAVKNSNYFAGKVYNSNTDSEKSFQINLLVTDRSLRLAKGEKLDSKVDSNPNPDRKAAPAVVLAPEKTDDRNFEAFGAFTGAWFPVAYMDDPKDKGLNTSFGLENFGMSATVNLKFFKDYGAYFGLQIDDPTFQKMVDFLGYLNLKWVLLRFDYHTFSGVSTWSGSGGLTDTPIVVDNAPALSMDFNTTWMTFSLLLDLGKIFNAWMGVWDHPNWLLRYGFLYGSANMPFEYFSEKPELSKNGFGWVDNKFYGMAIMLDIMEPWASAPTFSTWFYMSSLVGLSGNGEFDTASVARMGEINGYTAEPISTKAKEIMFTKSDIMVAVNKTWNVGKYAELNLAFGFEVMFDSFMMSNDDIKLEAFLVDFGPLLRLEMKF